MSEARTARILVVEDDEAIADGLMLNLERKGYEATWVADGQRAVECAGAERYDLILLDVRLPGLDGFEVCQAIRSANDFTPILMLTARGQPDDVVYGLKLGADDYVVKPFDLGELLARIESLLRRKLWLEVEPEQSEWPPCFRFGEYWVDFRTWQAKTLQGELELSRKELAVLKVFSERPNEVVTRRELLENVWELPNHPNTRVVDNVIVALRRAFEPNSWRPRHIHSVRGAGYRFTP